MSSLLFTMKADSFGDEDWFAVIALNRLRMKTDVHFSSDRVILIYRIKGIQRLKTDRGLEPQEEYKFVAKESILDFKIRHGWLPVGNQRELSNSLTLKSQLPKFQNLDRFSTSLIPELTYKTIRLPLESFWVTLSFQSTWKDIAFGFQFTPCPLRRQNEAIWLTT